MGWEVAIEGTPDVPVGSDDVAAMAGSVGWEAGREALGGNFA